MGGLDLRLALLSAAIAVASGCTSAETGAGARDPRGDMAGAFAGLALRVPIPSGGTAAAQRAAAARRTREVQDRGPALVRWRGSAGWGTGTGYQRLYDPARVTTVRGRLLRLERVRPFAGMGPGVQAVLSTERGILRVHLGPRWFLEQQDTPLRTGAVVEVTGAVARLHGRDVLLAAEVQAGDARVLKLRDGLGLPFWSWARRPQPPQAEE